MGWAHGQAADGRDIGYGVIAKCDFAGCNLHINRGLGHCCGSMHESGNDDGCGKYFCEKHRNKVVHGCEWQDDEHLFDAPEFFCTPIGTRPPRGKGGSISFTPGKGSPPVPKLGIGPGPHGSVIFNDAEGQPVLELTGYGDVLVHGNKVADDFEVYRGVVSWLRTMGMCPELVEICPIYVGAATNAPSP